MAEQTESALRRFGVLGLSYRSECFRGARGLRLSDIAQRRETLAALRATLDIDEAVVVSTCNRVELYFLTKTPLTTREDPRFDRIVELLGATGEQRSEMQLWSGDAATQHLFEVASALDSMVIGEAQILGQLRRAWDEAKEEGWSGEELDQLFEGAVRTARRVRGATDVGRGKLSLFSLVLDDVRRHLSDIDEPTVALLGAGEMIEKVANALSETACACSEDSPAVSTRMLFANRTLERARTLADVHGGEATTLEAFFSSTQSVDVIVTATSAPVPVLQLEQVSALASAKRGPLLIIDLAVPSDVAADAAALEQVVVIGMKDLKYRAEENRRARMQELEHGRAIVAEGLERLQRAGDRRRLAAAAPALQGCLEALVTADACLTDSKPIVPLLVRRAHKVLMSELQRRVGEDEVDVDAVLASLAVASCTEPQSRDEASHLRRPLASPEALDRKRWRSLGRDQKAELERWFDAQASRVALALEQALLRRGPTVDAATHSLHPYESTQPRPAMGEGAVESRQWR